MITERLDSQPLDGHALATCFQAHRKLSDAAAAVTRQLSCNSEDVELLRLGASCMRIAAHEALAARDPRARLRSWRECGLAERQIRLATYRALRARTIGTDTYDLIFALARDAARIREHERQRIRRQLLALTII